MTPPFSLVWFIFYATLSIVFGVGNIILQNHIHIEEWWIAFYLKDADLSCGGNIINVEITDNANYNGMWLPFNSTIYAQYNQCGFLHQNAPFTAPLTVRITKNNDLHTIIAYDVIESFTPDQQYDFGSNFCITTDPPSQTTVAPTLYPSQNPTSSTLNPSKYPTMKPTKNPTQNPTKYPSQTPTKLPTQNPTIYPTINPSKTPSKYPTIYPSINPTSSPIAAPTIYPTLNPSYFPTLYPTLNTAKPSNFIVAANPTKQQLQPVSSAHAQETTVTVETEKVLNEANDTISNELIKTLNIAICILTVIIICLLIYYCYKNKNEKKEKKTGGQHLEMKNIKTDSDEQESNKCKETPVSSENIERIIAGICIHDSLKNVVKIERTDGSSLSNNDKEINVIDIVMNNNENEGYQDIITRNNNIDILDVIDGHSDSEDLYGESLKEKEYITPIGDKHEKTTTMGPDIEDDNDNYKD